MMTSWGTIREVRDETYIIESYRELPMLVSVPKEKYVFNPGEEVRFRIIHKGNQFYLGRLHGGGSGPERVNQLLRELQSQKPANILEQTAQEES